jgi:hypothetical protein
MLDQVILWGNALKTIRTKNDRTIEVQDSAA